MQIIEFTDLGVRSAVIRLRRRGTPMQFVIYPMIHMAQPGFYAAVTRRLTKADVIVAEGVRGGSRPSLLSGALTMSYSILRFNRRAGLVEEDIDYRALGRPVIEPDVTADEFAHGWRRIPVLHRMLFWLVLPAVLMVRMVGGTRMIWTREVEMDDLPSAQDEAVTDRYPGFDEAMLGDRDQRLLDALSRLHDERHDQEIEIAVVDGAGHVPAVVHGLAARHGYRPASAGWLTVADL
ncbi:hypothetical protein ACWT_3612 [Actinoplanes sp. SE50]|uniref:hypothetical protein n=1 Tax=unclassified Actinoplanes TaxID=2626549 RepID=UPI00023EC470|nr:MULTISPECIES: hypothetical protein [unclassified Actinoplanes]AEV84635.1 hypothetical protein ACPL_3740 [Actinoplanes sp. SE50/110]ATO83027.1 hypothetical protein ACWT_3612 [Actinoplanes sp. SE50]SLM00435.1 hypothetical protein ACSP50_3667 [Actinoplanes sp. SE50/110]